MLFPTTVIQAKSSSLFLLMASNSFVNGESTYSDAWWIVLRHGSFDLTLDLIKIILNNAEMYRRVRLHYFHHSLVKWSKKHLHNFKYGTGNKEIHKLTNQTLYTQINFVFYDFWASFRSFAFDTNIHNFRTMNIAEIAQKLKHGI